MTVIKMPAVKKYRRKYGRFGTFDYKHDKSVLTFDNASSVYNFDMSYGVLRDGYGTSRDSDIPECARRYWVYRYYSEPDGKYIEQYIYQIAEGLLAKYDCDTGVTSYISGTVYAPFDAINYRLNSQDVLLLSCDGHRLITWNGTELIEHTSGPTISSMALHYERLFVTSKSEPTKVFFSDDLDPTDWNVNSSGGGFIELLDERGFLNKVVSFGSYLYIFRDHGISKVSASGEQSGFSAVNMFVTAGRIYPSSIATCGSTIMFSASDGLYAFDGYECRRVLLNLDGLISPSDGCACAYHDGKYYLACRMNFGDDKTVGCESGDYGVNGLVIYDVTSGECSLSRGLDISFMNSCSYRGRDFLMCCDGGIGAVITKCGKRIDDSLPKHWQSAETDFYLPDRKKLVRDVYLQTDADCSITVQADTKTKSAFATPKKDRLRVGFSCKRMSLAIDSDRNGCCVRPPTVVYSCY